MRTIPLLVIASLTTFLPGCGQPPTELQSLVDSGELTAEEAYATARQQVQADLEALSALAWFEVQGLVTDGMEPGMCYGPCEDEDQRIEKYLEQADRLHELVDLAENPDDSYVCYTRATDIVDESLQALRDLELVGVGDMIAVEPNTQPHCYNLPCPEDIEAAEAQNEGTATLIWQLSVRSEGL